MLQNGSDWCNKLIQSNKDGRKKKISNLSLGSENSPRIVTPKHFPEGVTVYRRFNNDGTIRSVCVEAGKNASGQPKKSVRSSQVTDIDRLYNDNTYAAKYIIEAMDKFTSKHGISGRYWDIDDNNNSKTRIYWENLLKQSQTIQQSTISHQPNIHNNNNINS